MLGKLEPAQIEHVLQTEVVGRIGCHADGRTYVVPVTYAYRDGAVYGHTGKGLKVEMMRQNPHVCFEVDHMVDMTNWQSVIAWGDFEELHGQEAERAMVYLMERMAPLATSETAFAHGDAAHAVSAEALVYRIRLADKTGRFEERSGKPKLHLAPAV